jgi:nicotinamidase-related amidase
VYLSGTIVMNSAVLVIDVQVGLFAVEPRPYEANEVVQRINSLISRARIAGFPVFFIQHEQAGSLLEYGSEGWQLSSDLTVCGTDFKIRKTTPDSFLKTPLADQLQKLGIDNLIICGYASEFCVDTTVRRSAAYGYSVQLVADGHTTHEKAHASAAQIRAHHNATLSNIRSFGPVITALAADEIFCTVDA